MVKSWKPFFVTILIVLVLFPFIYLLLLSMSSGWAFPQIIPSNFGFDNWKAITQSEVGLFTALMNSILIALTVASIATFGGFILSRIVAYHKQKNSLILISYFPYILSPVVFGACLSFFFMKVNLFGNMGGVIIAQLIISLPYALIFFGSFWNEKNRNIENLVATLGGNKIVSFVKVILPLAKGLLLVCFFQTFLISWFEYGLTAIIGLGKVQTLTIKVFLYIKEANFFYGALSSCLLIMPPVILLYLNKRFVFNRMS